MTGFVFKQLTPEARDLMEITAWQLESWMPLWVWPFAVAAFAALCGMAYFRLSVETDTRWRIAMASLRALAYVLLLMVIARPALEWSGRGAPAGPVPVILDASLSMSIEDEPGQPRFEEALRAWSRMQETNPDPQRVRLAGFWAGDTFYPLEPDMDDGQDVPGPDGEITDLPSAAARALARFPGLYVPGIILLTDGAHNAPMPADTLLDQMKQQGIPVYPVGIGAEFPRDVAVTQILGEDVIFKDERARVFISLQQTGYENQPVRVRLQMNDRDVFQETVQLSGDREQLVPVEYEPDQTGAFTLRASVDTLPDEVTVENNVFERSVRVIDEQIRVLLVFGTPSWEYRYLAGAFERDRRITHDSFLLSADPRVLRARDARYVPSLPATADALNAQYDLVLLSGMDASVLPRGFVDALNVFVEEKGGGLIMLSDPRHIPYSLPGTNLEPLLPVRFDNALPMSYQDELFNPVHHTLRLELTEEGAANPLMLFSGDTRENERIWSEFPPVPRGFQHARLKPAAVALATFRAPGGATHPAVVFQQYGRGLVLFFGFDSTWRWRREHGNRYYGAFWGKTVQFMGLPHLLGESAQSMIFVNNENVSVGQPVPVRARISNADFSPYAAQEASAQVLQDGEIQTISLRALPGRPGVFEGEWVPTAPGEATLSLSERFNAAPLTLRATRQLREFQDAGMNRAWLERVATETGGRFFLPDEAEDVMSALFERRPLISLHFRKTLWDARITWLLVALLFSAEWACRRWRNLD